MNRVNLTEEEKVCFTRIETFDAKNHRSDVKYVITEPWRYIMKIAPHMVTHVKLMDVDIERELTYIKGHIDNHNLMPRMHRLTNGRRFRWNDEFNERPKYINKFKNIPRYANKELYMELET